MDGEIITNHLQPKDTLDIMRSLARGKIAPDKALCSSFNKATNNGRNMGKVSQLLEDAGHSGDNEYIAAHAVELLERCRRLAYDLAPLFKSEELPLISDAELKEAYTLIQEFISVSDLKSVIQIIDNLKEYSYPDSEKEKCEKLKAFAAEFDYEGISKVMSK